MPRGDRRGPMGQGPRSGRGLGYCSGNDQPGWAADGAGMGFGRGGGRGAGRGQGGGFGRGRRNWANYNDAPPPPMNAIPNETADVSAELAELREELHELKALIKTQMTEDSEPDN